MEKQTLGVIGGMGPEATAYFYEQVIRHTRASCDQDHLDMVILSCASMPDRTAAIEAADHQPILTCMRSCIERLDACGVGLAAPQVGVLRRVVVVDTGEDGILELINPEIIDQSGSQTGLEGCLSVPGKYGIVTRPNVVTVRAQDRDGNWFEVEGEALIARCFCHELAHLDGQLYTEVAERMLTPEELQELTEGEEAED